MADEALRRQMGERARAYCGERYSREKILDQFVLGVDNGGWCMR